jgi:hypothetical protein
MPKDKKDEDYKVGFGKPPRRTQFKAGQSGNRNGRPRGSRNLNTLLEQELKQRLVVTENGRRKELTKMQAAIKNLVNKGLTDRRFMQLLLDAIREMEMRNEASSVVRAPLEDVDQQIIENFLSRIKGGDDDSET